MTQAKLIPPQPTTALKYRLHVIAAMKQPNNETI